MATCRKPSAAHPGGEGAGERYGQGAPCRGARHGEHVLHRVRGVDVAAGGGEIDDMRCRGALQFCVRLEGACIKQKFLNNNFNFIFLARSLEQKFPRAAKKYDWKREQNTVFFSRGTKTFPAVFPRFSSAQKINVLWHRHSFIEMGHKTQK